MSSLTLACMRSNCCLPFFSRSVVFVLKACAANLLTVNAFVKKIPAPLRKTPLERKLTLLIKNRGTMSAKNSGQI